MEFKMLDKVSLLLVSLSPRACIKWTSFNRHSDQEIFIAIVNRLMSAVQTTNQILWIQQKITASQNVFFGNRVHVMDYNSYFSFYLPVKHSEIATVITNDY